MGHCRVEKCEEPIPILVDSLLQRGADLGRALQDRHVIQKTFGRPRVFPAYRSGRSPDWLKMKNSAHAVVEREAEEDWGR